MDHSLPGSSVHGILQARTLEWVAMSSSRDLPNSGIEPTSPISPALAGEFFTTSATWEVYFRHVGVHAQSPQLHLILCNPMDHSLPGSSVHGILQARILEWVAMSSSKGSS